MPTNTVKITVVTLPDVVWMADRLVVVAARALMVMESAVEVLAPNSVSPE